MKNWLQLGRKVSLMLEICLRSVAFSDCFVHWGSRGEEALLA